MFSIRSLDCFKNVTFDFVIFNGPPFLKFTFELVIFCFIFFNSILFILLLIGGSTSDRLQEVYKPVLSDAACTGYLSNAYNANTMLCAGLDAGGKDACQVNTLFAFAVLCLVTEFTRRSLY